STTEKLGKEIEALKREIAARQHEITWLNKGIEAKEKSGDAIDGLIPKIDDETEKIKKEGSIVIEVSDAWTRWADSVRNRTDAAIAGLPVIEDEIKIVLEVSDAWTHWAAIFHRLKLAYSIFPDHPVLHFPASAFFQ
ncbi:unnamed protein product, partial [marine sediment metagenome]